MNTQSEQIDQIATALSKAQGMMTDAKKDKSNPFFKSQYADLSSVWDACREALSTNGLSVVQTMDESTEGRFSIITKLLHSSGQWISSRMPVICAKQDAQSLGSAITYYRRYCLSAIVGSTSAVEDDDGNRASGNKNTQQQASATQKFVNYITKEQVEVLKGYLDQDNDYANRVYKRLNESFSISALEQLTPEIYEKVIIGAKKNLEEKMKS